MTAHEAGVVPGHAPVVEAGFHGGVWLAWRGAKEVFMPLFALAHASATAHLHGDAVDAALGILLVVAVALAPRFYHEVRRALSRA